MAMGACPGQIPMPCVPPALMVTATMVRACRYSESFMLNISLMQCYFFKYLLGFLYNLAGFRSNIKEVQEKFPAKFSMFLRANPYVL